MAAEYVRMGYELRDTRWVAQGGELDLILNGDCGLIFCEVKKSHSHDQALQRITPTKQQRLFQTAQAYLSAKGLDQLTDVRFDIALVDQAGQVKIIEDAFV